MTKEYSMTLVPIPLDGPVLYRGKDYTTSAQKHNVELGEQKFYVRENLDSGDILRQALSPSLEQIVRMIKPSVPITISLLLKEEKYASQEKNRRE